MPLGRFFGLPNFNDKENCLVLRSRLGQYHPSTSKLVLTSMVLLVVSAAAWVQEVCVVYISAVRARVRARVP